MIMQTVVNTTQRMAMVCARTVTTVQMVLTVNYAQMDLSETLMSTLHTQKHAKVCVMANSHRTKQRWKIQLNNIKMKIKLCCGRFQHVVVSPWVWWLGT